MTVVDRSFSKLKFIKTYKRSTTVGMERLSTFYVLKKKTNAKFNRVIEKICMFFK